MDTNLSADVVDNPAMKRFELQLDEDEYAAAYYRLEDGRIVIVHTEVPFRFSGQGIASQLAQAVLEQIRGRGLKIVPQCQFFAAYLAKHPEYSDLIA
jgi:predicted GNAT family acetyltransferase